MDVTDKRRRDDAAVLRLCRGDGSAGGEGLVSIVLPEKLGVVLDAENGSADADLAAVAARTGATIVAGVVHVDALGEVQRGADLSCRS